MMDEQHDDMSINFVKEEKSVKEGDDEENTII